MSNTIVLNSNNVIGSNNNTFQFNFIQGAFKCKDYEMSIGSLTIPYSWFNVSTYYNNTKFILNYPYYNGVLNTFRIIDVVLPNGFYTVSDINNYIQLQCINNGLYLTSNGQNIYFFTITTNVSAYANQIVSILVPSTSNYASQGYSLPPSGYWSGTGGFSLPTVADRTAYINFTTATGTIAPILGFTAPGYYPLPNGSSQSVLSNITPNATNVNGLVVRCNLVNNNITMPSDILDSVPINATFGSNITYTPAFPKWVKVKDGAYNSLVITFADQNLNTLYAQDPNILLTLMLRKIGSPD